MRGPARRHVLTAAAAAALAAGAAGTTPAAVAARSTDGTTTAESRGTRPMNVDIVMFEGVEELDYAAPYEVFALAARHSGRPANVRLVSLDGPGVLRCAHGSEVRVTDRWDPDEADLLVVPGGGYQRQDGGPGVRAEIERGALPRALADAARDVPHLTLASVCTGSMLLSAAGLTRNRPCTTHHLSLADLEEQGGVLKKARVVDDGDLVTAGGITSGLDLALWLVRRELGADTALRLEAMLEYEARGTVWSR
ncbi:AraC family transcriptional regulator [Streptomyces sp. CC53]|uniref:DJ-1/PfpI family protein n=1 Tax=unclassified Streptomyces TaxID=2593676 RepID=UPI0008DD9BDD|nr:MULTISPECIES: DJ-1/PfpI family protein [unclassified Streptomyces]OII60931.1 AraC family transcriptional regulator [Streptomyces sp. CC53]